MTVINRLAKVDDSEVVHRKSIEKIINSDILILF